MLSGIAVPGVKQISVKTSAEMTKAICVIASELREAGFSDKEVFGARLSLEEAIVNGLRHGNRYDLAKSVTLTYSVTSDQFMIEIQDEGKGFDFDGLPDPLAPTRRERPGGRGVFLIRQYMSWVSYNELGNCVTLCKVRGQ